jgi:S-adenosylmethionine:tRNA ribosyltransferase-isomerase
VRTADFDYPLPESLIAQAPLERRDDSRLLVLDRSRPELEHRHFRDLVELLPSPALLVFNDSRVIRARLRAQNSQSSGLFEVLLLEQNQANDWWAMVRPGKRAKLGGSLILRHPTRGNTGIVARVAEINEEGHRRLHFSGTPDLLAELEELGELPLPPYIERPAGSRDPKDDARYQTIYAGQPGSIAAPTAGLHFTQELLAALEARGVNLARTTLHVGAGTFAPVKSELISDHHMHSECYTLDAINAEKINQARQAGTPIIAVGTTTLRVLESIARLNTHNIVATQGRTDIFIYPPAEFQVVTSLITNFHLPQSTLLMLVSAFASPGRTEGRERILSAYGEAIEKRYRFFSYGDAMWIR